MKKLALIIVIVLSTFSCNSTKEIYTSNSEYASVLLNSLNSDSSIAEVYYIFKLLDCNKDKAITSLESIGTITENFNVLDTDKNASINFSEFKSVFLLLN